MGYSPYDIVGIGNAIVDIIAVADDAFLAKQSMAKGTMTLVDERRADAIYADMPRSLVRSGGSAANTAAGVGFLGGRPAFIGKVRNDRFGTAFRSDIQAAGTTFRTPAGSSGPATARSLILVTPDGERTMATYLGAAATFGPPDLNVELIRAAKIAHFEGYLYDERGGRAVVRLAAAIACAAGRKVSLSLSDIFCVERHRRAFINLIETNVDIVLGNAEEMMSLFRTKSLDALLARLKTMGKIMVVTRGALGSVIVTPHDTFAVPAVPVARVIDSTGAGDMYCAGFLFGIASGTTPREAAHLGSLASAQVIRHLGARPEHALEHIAVG